MARGGARRPAGRGRGTGTAAAVAAVGLIALSGPATELGAHVVAARTTAVPAAPAPAAALAPAPVVAGRPALPLSAGPVPAVPAAVVAVPRPGPVEVVPPMVPRGRPLETELRADTACSGHARPRQIVPGVVPGPGTATVSWQADASADVRGYRVQAVSQLLGAGAQPDPPALLAAQPAGCQPVEVTFAGLTPGAAYVFWLEEEIEDSLSLRWVQAGRSPAVVVG